MARVGPQRHKKKKMIHWYVKKTRIHCRYVCLRGVLTLCSRECVWLINMCILFYLCSLLFHVYDERPGAQAGVFQGARNIKP
jgi:hypothetical protein